ncbi:MAG: GxxExxY protein [Bacteroidales bacterium]|nr:GxxExxY protein [Bacteroidota bacterium]MBO6057884.1 GxxExxY protein [Bacteroidales bacterium]MBO7529617.1 GxxExxY protein [Bacteroidales bacterium]
MDLIKSYNKKYEFFRDITGVAMKVYNKYKYGLAESAYEAAIKYLLEKDGYYVECQAYLPIYWDDVKLDKNYRMDLVVNEEIIIELKAVSFIDMQHRKQLWNYMRLTHLPYGMLINFGNEKNLYSEWYQYNVGENTIEKIQLL